MLTKTLRMSSALILEITDIHHEKEFILCLNRASKLTTDLFITKTEVIFHTSAFESEKDLYLLSTPEEIFTSILFLVLLWKRFIDSKVVQKLGALARIRTQEPPNTGP